MIIYDGTTQLYLSSTSSIGTTSGSSRANSPNATTVVLLVLVIFAVAAGVVPFVALAFAAAVPHPNS